MTRKMLFGEPWRFDKETMKVYATDEHGDYVMADVADDFRDIALWKRIVACVNACAGRNPAKVLQTLDASGADDATFAEGMDLDAALEKMMRERLIASQLSPRGRWVLRVMEHGVSKEDAEKRWDIIVADPRNRGSMWTQSGNGNPKEATP